MIKHEGPGEITGPLVLLLDRAVESFSGRSYRGNVGRRGYGLFGTPIAIGTREFGM